MFHRIDPKKMQSLMRQMGISQEEINSKKVIIETDEKRIIIKNPSVTKITLQGQESFQISGEITEEQKHEDEESLKEDIKIIIEKTGCSENEARKALEKFKGDLAEAILSLTK